MHNAHDTRRTHAATTTTNPPRRAMLAGGTAALLAGAILAVALMIVSAEAGAKNYDLMGMGVSSCGAWTAARHPRGGATVANEQWILGFLSGVGSYAAADFNPLRGVDAYAVWAWVDNYCGAHPLDDIAAAGTAFVFAHPH